MKREVPTNIKAKMRTAAKLFARASGIMAEIDAHFEKMYPTVDIETFRSGNSHSLEEIEYGDDITDEFVEWYESIDWDKEDER